MDLSERVAVSPQLPADEGVNQSVGQTPRNLLVAQSHHGASRDLRQPALTTDGWELQQPGGHSLQLEFQDSNLSPALSLLPANSGVEHNFTEYSFFHQSDNEFASLRAYPDISIASERFHVPPQDRTTQDSEHGSLSQHPLAQASVLSEELASSCCSLSQHSLSPGEENQQEEIAHSPLNTTTEDTGSREKDSESPGKLVREAAEDEMFFLRKDIPAQQLLECLQKDIGMLSSSSASRVSSASGMSVKSIASLIEGSKSTKVCKPDTDQSMLKREGPPGEASPPHQQTQQPDRGTNPGQSQTLSSEVCNITMGSRSTQPDDFTEALHRELLSEAERQGKHEAESKNQQRKSPTPPDPSLTPNPTEMSECNSDVTRTNPGGVPWTGPFSGGTVQVHREQDLWSSGNQTGIEGSYLGFLPQSQSTPGVFRAPPKSTVKKKLGQLSVVESIKESSYLSDIATSLQPAVPVVEDHCPYMEKQSQEEATSAKVQSLPSLNYMQKVDAWRVNQNSLMSLFDSLALQGFSGIAPKKKAYDAVSDTLNNILSQQVKSLQQPPISRAAHQTVTQNSSTAPSGSSSPRRGEALGGAPNDKDNTGSVARTGTSPFGRSQSHSSLSTVVMLVQKDQQSKEETQDNAQQPSTTVQPSPLMSLGQFSDVSVDRDVTPSSSQDSYNSEVKLRASNGASSVTSLEVDNYAPYWTSKPSTPPPQPRHREFNIEERIPLYLHNLGIDQSPSTILTPFAPRGPIREPEFSPTDFCTIKGSIGTPTKSAQPSEGGSPHKGEFSRSSIWSVDTNISIPFSLDSLGPAVSIPDIEAIQIARRVASSSQSDEGVNFTILQPSQQQQKDTSLTSSQNAVQLGERFDSDVSLGTKLRCTERNFESPLQTSRTLNQTTEDSFVSSKALWEIHKLMSRAENVVSTVSSAASSTSTAVPHLLSDGDVFLSLKTKTTTLQNSSFSSSSAAEDTRTRSSFLGARSSSDSMLTSEKQRQNLVGQKTMRSSWKQSYPSTQALITATAAHTGPQDGTAGSSLGLPKPARRAEPEGCSAAPPDSKVPTQPPVVKPLPPVSMQQLSSAPSDIVGAPEEEERTKIGGPAQSSSSSPILEDMDQGVVSDGSSESSLAVRVAKLLQSESPSTMVSSSTSITDQEDGKAREWIKLKISGQQCEPLVLDKEDRERIEEIKKELLLKNPMKSPGSTDTESNATSSVGVPLRQDPPLPAETFSTFSDVNNQLMQGLSTDQSDSSAQLQHPLPNLEAHVREIAAREGVSLPRTHPRALTSITIATRRRSTSSSRSMSPLSPAPGPLDLTELSTGAVDHPTNIKQPLPPSQDEENKMTTEPALVFETSSSVSTRNQNPNSQLISGNQKRLITVGSQLEDCPTTSRNLHREDMNELSVQDGSISGGHRADQATGSTACESPARTGHISHVHLTLSPKATDHSQAIAVHSSNADDFTGLPQKVFVPVRHSACVASSPDEGVGLSSPPEWFKPREQIRQQGLEMTNTSMLFKTVVPQGRITLTSTQLFTPRPRPEDSPGCLNTESPAVPVLLPYKPRGSEELFYVPQTEAEFSSTAPSDTTMESSHTGSDDAVPPRFSSEVLGHQDPGLDRGVTIRHREGIYSKRFKTATFKMQQPEHTAAEKSTQTSESQAPKQSPLVSVAFTSVPISSKQETCKRDQGTSPVQFLSYDQPELGSNALQPVHVEMDSDRTSHLNHSFVAQAERMRDQQRTNPGVPYPASQQRTLDQLWQRFCARWSLEESRLTTEREASLLERLERLSHLIHSTRAANVSEQQGEEYNDPYSIKQKMGLRQKDAAREEKKQAVRGDLPIHRHAWTQRLQVEETSQPAEDDSHASFTSTLSHTSFQSQHLCPADRDETDTLSTTSGSMSTVDTARLIRAFGAHRVQHLKTSSSLSKLYSTINKQKEVREKSRGTKEDPPDIITPSETTGTDESVAADSASSTSTYTLPSRHGNPRSMAAKKAVKLVSKGIQAGDLEIVSNGTRRHTRDVGTTFPSPGETRAPIPISSSSLTAERRTGGQRSPSKSQGLQKQRKSKRSPSKPYPEGVSWFISVDDVRSDARKENQPEESSSLWRPSTAWFEPYSRRHAWREPLRQRQISEDRNQHPVEPDHRSKTVSSGLARVSLQEALEMRCPWFISQSRQRVRRLAVQVEERKLRAVFTRERGLYNQPGELGRLPKPAGTALLRRAVPRKEMIQRSKQIYENLPEVQRRREEERRKAEYRSFRLNAQLYNKRITNRVLGRRSVWQ